MQPLVYLLIAAMIMPPLCSLILLVSTQVTHTLTQQLATSERAFLSSLIHQDILSGAVYHQNVRYSLTSKGLKRHEKRSHYLTDILPITTLTQPTHTHPCLTLETARLPKLTLCPPTLP